MSSTPTLAKIARPALVQHYRRERLFAQLDELREVPVVWLTAPPGAGKTTLVSSYVEDRALQAVWYQLDEGDSDTAAFFYYLGLAAQRLAPGRLGHLPTLSGEFQGDATAFARNFLRELYAAMPEPAVVVLENYQDAPGDPELQAVLQLALTEVPPGLNLLVLSRTPPPPSLSRLRAHGQIAVLDWEQLRLTPEETAGIARLHDDAELAERDLEALYRQTRGWVAGLVLLLQRPLGETGVAELDPEQQELVFDYFAEEIFQHKSPAQQEFLLKTAFLPQVSVATARALTGQRQPGRILNELVRSNYFTTRISGDAQAYEYHPLFRRFLLDQAAQRLSEEQLVRTRRHAAELLAAEGEVEPAAQLLIELRDWPGLAGLVLHEARALVEQGRRQTLLSWLDRLPEQLLDGQPWLVFWRGACLHPVDIDASRLSFERAFAGFRASGEATGAYLSAVSIMEAYFYCMADFRPLDLWLERVEELRREFPDWPSPEVEARVSYGVMAATMWRRPDDPELQHWVQRCEALLDSELNLPMRLMLGHGLAVYYIRWRGRLSKSARIIDLLRPQVENAELPPVSLIMWRTMLASQSWVSNEHETGLQAVEEGLNLARRHGVHIFDLLLTGLGVYCHLTGGDLRSAQRYLEQMPALLRQRAVGDIGHYHYLMAWAASEGGNLAEAREHAEKALRQSIDADAGLSIAYNQITLAQILLESGEHRPALKLLNEARRMGRRMDNDWLEYHYLLSRAEIHLFHGRDYGKGLRVLAEGLALGRSHGYVAHPWLGWRRRLMLELLTAALENGIEVDYVQMLIRARGLLPDQPPLDVEHWPWAVKIRVLDSFEVVSNGEPRAVKGKPAEILELLTGQPGGRPISAGHLLDALWPDAEGDAAHHTLETTLYRLRKLLGHNRALVFRDGRLSLDPRLCWVDAWAVEHLLQKLDAALLEIPPQPDTLVYLLDRLLRLYRAPPAEAVRDPAPVGGSPLHLRVQQSLLRLGEFWEGRQDWQRAADTYQRGLQFNPAAEAFYQRLMRCYAALGWQSEVLHLYRQCRGNLERLLGVAPSPETEALVKKYTAAVGPA